MTLLLFLDLPAVVQKSRGQYLHQLQLGPQPHRVRDVSLPAAGSEVWHVVPVRCLQLSGHHLLHILPSRDKGQVSRGHGGALLQAFLETWKSQMIISLPNSFF